MAAARLAASDPPARMTRASVGGSAAAAAEVYPRSVLVNFRQLKISTLKRYARRFNVQVHPNATAAELAVAVARHYDRSLHPREEEVVENFSKYVRFCAAVRAGGRSRWCEHLQCAARSTHDAVAIPATRATRARRAQQTNPHGPQTPYYMQQGGEEAFGLGLTDPGLPPGRRAGPMAEQVAAAGNVGAGARRKRERGAEAAAAAVEEEDDEFGAERYCLCDRVSFGEMIGCDADDCALGGGWFHISCVGLTPATMPADGQQWFCPQCRTPGLPHLHKSSSVAAGRHSVGDMIALALAATQHRQATYRGICQFIEHAFDGMLGDGRDSRNSSVLKSSVRKSLLSSPRFRRIDDAGEVYTFA